MAFLPRSVDFTKFTECPILKYNNDTDFSVQLLYSGRPLTIETEFMTLILGLQQYSNPGSSFKNYSISIALRSEEDRSNPKDEFNILLTRLEDAVKSFTTTQIDAKFSDYQYENLIQEPSLDVKDKNPGVYHIRLKIPSNKRRLKIDLYHGKEHFVLPTINQAKALIRHGVKARCKLEMKPVWWAKTKNGLRFGYSFYVSAIEIQKNEFHSSTLTI